MWNKQYGQCNPMLVGICIGFIVILGAMYLPNYVSPRYRSQYMECFEQLKNISTGMQTQISDRGNLKGVQSESDICHYIISANRPGHCADEMRKQINDVCKPDSLKVRVIDDFSYEIEAVAKDKEGTLLCVTEAGIDPQEYGEKPKGCKH